MPAASLVFISYSRRDYYFAESLAFHLLRNGVQAWMDVKDLEPGDHWEDDLERALDSASTVLLIWSKEAVASERVRDEWQRALKRGTRTIILLARNALLHVELQTCEAVDFRGSFSGAMRYLMPLLVPAGGTLYPPVRRAYTWRAEPSASSWWDRVGPLPTDPLSLLAMRNTVREGLRR